MPQFNPGQQALIDAPLNEKVVGVAGAGTGKTTTILGRTQRILKEMPTGKLVLITFTRAAANDLRERLYKLINEDDRRRIVVGTFHSVMGKLIRDHAVDIGLTPTFSIIDETSTQMMIQSAIEQDSELLQTIQDLILGPNRKSLLNDDKIEYQQITSTEYPKYYENSPVTHEWWGLIDNPEAKREYREYIIKHPSKDDRYDPEHYKLMKKDYTNIVRNISTMVNVAHPEELMTGQFEPVTKQRLAHLTEMNDIEINAFLPLYYRIFKATLKLGRDTNTITYDHILFITYLMQRSGLLKPFKESLTHVIVDEYQDTNRLQDSFIRYIGENHLTLVGDIDQAIYEFRGGEADLLSQHADEGHVVNLTVNYRSYQPILDAANALIEHNQSGQNIRKPLEAHRQIGDKGHQFDGVSLHLFTGEYADSDSARKMIEYMQFLHKRANDPVDYNDMAILIRSRRTINPIKAKLQTEKLPVNDTTGYADFMRSQVMTDMLNFIKIWTNPQDIYAFLSVLDRPKRGLGPKAIDKLQTNAATYGLSLVEYLMSEHVAELTPSVRKKVNKFMDTYLELLKPERKKMKFTDFIDYLLVYTGYQGWVEGLNKKSRDTHMSNIQQLKNFASDYMQQYENEHPDATLYDVASSFTFEVTNAATKKDHDGITITTIHGAKGLEWSHVFILGLEEENFPGNKVTTQSDLEAERRLMYVAITRAKDGLWMDECEHRMAFNKPLNPSSFIQDMDDNYNTLIE